MKNYFQYQTGAISFSVSFTAESASGSASINIGCEGLTQSGITFYLDNGNIKDSDGIYFGSYIPKRLSTINGISEGDSCAYYYNDLPIRTHYRVGNQDLDFIDFSKNGGDSGNYELSYSVGGKAHSADRNILYISNDFNRETGIANMISGMSLFNEIQTGYGDYTGILSSDATGFLGNYDLIVFGQHVSGNHFIDKSGWAGVEAPIVILNPLVANGDNLGMFSGSLMDTSGDERTWAYGDDSEANPKHEIYKSLTRRTLPKSSVFDLYGNTGQKFLDYKEIHYTGNNVVADDSAIYEISDGENFTSNILIEPLSKRGHYVLDFELFHYAGANYDKTGSIYYSSQFIGTVDAIGSGPQSLTFEVGDEVQDSDNLTVVWEEKEAPYYSSVYFAPMSLKNVEEMNLEPLFYNDTSERIGMIDSLEAGEIRCMDFLAQSGQRFFFNTPCQFETALFDVVTENWKKIFLACIYESI